jgi:hypothetical protein
MIHQQEEQRIQMAPGLPRHHRIHSPVSPTRSAYQAMFLYTATSAQMKKKHISHYHDGNDSLVSYAVALVRQSVSLLPF